MYSYLLSGEVFVTHEEEVKILKDEIPFPLPYLTNFDKFGYIDIQFNHKVEERDDIKKLVDSGLLSIDLVNEQLDISVSGTAKQPHQLEMSTKGDSDDTRRLLQEEMNS